MTLEQELEGGEEMGHVSVWENKKYQGPWAGGCLACGRHSKEVSEAGVQQLMGRVSFI